MDATATLQVDKAKAVSAILWGGLWAGALDISIAFVRWGRPLSILKGIAGGLLGPRAFQGGWGTAALGLALHFFIAFSAAGVYYAASRKLAFLRRRAVLWGFLYGIAVYMFMSWVVVPLSALPKSKAPFSATGLAISLLTHMFCCLLLSPCAVTRSRRPDVGCRASDLSHPNLTRVLIRL